MANMMASAEQLRAIALSVFPDCDARAHLNLQTDMMDLFMRRKGATNQISLSARERSMSWNGIAELIRASTPSDWRQPTRPLLQQGPDDFDELCGG